MDKEERERERERADDDDEAILLISSSALLASICSNISFKDRASSWLWQKPNKCLLFPTRR